MTHRKRTAEEQSALRRRRERNGSDIEYNPASGNVLSRTDVAIEITDVNENIRHNKKGIDRSYKITAENFNEIMTIVKPSQEEAIIAENMVCTICFEEYTENREYRITPCKHIFHHECIYAWLITNRKKKCPNDNFKFR